MSKDRSQFTGESNLPVENVSWENCQVFLQRLSEKDGHEYRLPTEAEWEYACRAGTTTPYWFGETISTDNANCDGERTTPVGTFRPNAWGLHDMHGNVSEWCWDFYAPYYLLRSGPALEIVDPKAESTRGEKVRVMRGGSFSSQCQRSDDRNAAAPTSRFPDLGFRAVRNLRPEEKPEEKSLAQRHAELTESIAKLKDLTDSLGIKEIKDITDRIDWK